MSYAHAVPKEYGYVILVATSTFVLSFWHGSRVTPFRKRAGVPYPNQYASPEQIASATGDAKQAMYLFNCSQRAHYNYIENHLNMLAPMMIAGLRYPVASAVTGALWSVCRVMYAVGYTRADKENGKGRLIGSGSWACQFVLWGLSGTMGWKMLS